MRNRFYCIPLLLVGLIVNTSLFAQSNEVVEKTMRSNGKIFVVMAICITILAGLFLYVVSIDRKISRIEDKQ